MSLWFDALYFQPQSMHPATFCPQCPSRTTWICPGLPPVSLSVPSRFIQNPVHLYIKIAISVLHGLLHAGRWLSRRVVQRLAEDRCQSARRWKWSCHSAERPVRYPTKYSIQGLSWDFSKLKTKLKIFDDRKKNIKLKVFSFFFLNCRL